MILAAVGIATAALKLANPELRIIPIVLGSFGYTYGSLLGVFLLGMLTKNRGNCRGNLLAMACGLVATLVLSGAHNDIYDILHEKEARVRRAVVAVAKESKTPLKVVTVADAMALDDASLAAIAKKARLDVAETRAVFTHPNARAPFFERDWLPSIAFTWRIMAGTMVTFLVGVCFRRRSVPWREAKSHGGRWRATNNIHTPLL